ncbi:MAG: hypothetical protein B6243_01435 [Anaerolineaceae bacterium 4572_5.2]|nr:MAG: hypothetical protein B6243_01435 [Anaerolineaceae bacterium 4572_5.2]
MAQYSIVLTGNQMKSRRGAKAAALKERSSSSYKFSPTGLCSFSAMALASRFLAGNENCCWIIRI